MTHKVTKPIALDESLNTTEETPRNIADVLAEGLAGIGEAVSTEAELPLKKVNGKLTNNGNLLTVTGNNAWAEGERTEATAGRAHAEGYMTEASGIDSHAEGTNTRATGDSSHAEGAGCTASGKDSHAGGMSTRMSANGGMSTGRYNSDDTALFVVGNGTDTNNRSDAFKVDSDGHTHITNEAGNLVKVRGAGIATFTVTQTDVNTYTYPNESDVRTAISNYDTVILRLVKLGGGFANYILDNQTTAPSYTWVSEEGSSVITLDGAGSPIVWTWSKASRSIGGSVGIYGSLQDAIADVASLNVGDYFETNGFHTSGDGGAARYLVSNTGTANGMDVVQLAAGKLAIIKPVGDGLYPEQIGFKTGDNTYDLSIYIARIIAMNIRKIKLHFKSSYYYVKTTINISIPDVQIVGGLDVFSGYSTRLEYTGSDGKVFDISHRRFTAKHLYIQNSSGNVSAICFNSTAGSNHYKYKLQNIHISQFGYGCYFAGSTHWMHEFSDVTFDGCTYGMYFEQFLLCSRFTELHFSGCTEYDILFKTEPTAVDFANCNFGVNKHAIKFEYFDDPSHNRFGQVSFNSCSFEYDVDTSSIVNDSGFIAVDDEVNINLEFTGCNFSIQRLWYNDYTTARAISFGKKTRASFRGCQGAKLIEYAIRKQLFNENKPPMIELGSLKFIDNQQGFEIPAYTDQSATICVVTDSSEVECVESYGNNVLNKADCWKVSGSLYHDDIANENVFTASTGNIRTLVIPIPKYLMGKTVTLSIDTTSHNRFYLCASNLIPNSSATFRGTYYNVSPTTVGGRDYVTISVSTDWNYLLLYYSNNVSDEDAIANSIMMNADGIYTPYTAYASPSYKTRLIPSLIDLDSLVTALNARGNSLS